MSQGNVDVVRRFYDAYNARDTAAWPSLVAEEFQFQSVFVGVEGRVYGGGKVTRFITYWDRERALADLGLAAGLQEQDLKPAE